MNVIHSLDKLDLIDLFESMPRVVDTDPILASLFIVEVDIVGHSLKFSIDFALQ